jgi:hypothetical protein
MIVNSDSNKGKLEIKNGNAPTDAKIRLSVPTRHFEMH